MPSQRDGKPRNQAVTEAFQSIILPNRIISARPAVELGLGWVEKGQPNPILGSSWGWVDFPQPEPNPRSN